MNAFRITDFIVNLSIIIHIWAIGINLIWYIDSCVVEVST